MECERRIVTFHWVTADGHFAAVDGNLDWVETIAAGSIGDQATATGRCDASICTPRLD